MFESRLVSSRSQERTLATDKLDAEVASVDLSHGG